jgi:4-hydroxy-tetrahydrodipicolinate synthase
MDIEGSIPPMTTPISDETGEVNETVLREYTAFLADGGVHGLFPCGSTGEFPSLTRQQRKRVIETVVDAADGQPVLAGCGDTNLERVCQLIGDADDVGADAAVVVTPYYLETSQASLDRFYTRVADRSPLPVVLYDIPSLSGRQLTTDTVVGLADHDNVVGLKTSTSDLLQIAEVVRNTPSSFDVLPGFPELTISALDVGGRGVIAGPANVFPTVVADVYEHYQAGERQRAVQLLSDIVLPVLSTIRPMPTVPALKYLLTRRGFDVGSALAPMPELTAEQRGRLDDQYDEVVSSEAIEVDD